MFKNIQLLKEFEGYLTIFDKKRKKKEIIEQ